MRTSLAALPMAIAFLTSGASSVDATRTHLSGPRFEEVGDPSAAVALLVNDAVPAGAVVSEAEASLRRLGMPCHMQAGHAVERCRYDGPTTFEGDLVEFAYWTVALDVQQGRVVGIGIKRELDVH